MKTLPKKYLMGGQGGGETPSCLSSLLKIVKSIDLQCWNPTFEFTPVAANGLFNELLHTGEGGSR